MKIRSNYLVYSTVLSIILLSSISANESNFQVFAQSSDNEFIVRNAEQISKDPFARSILEKIELMKKRLAEAEESKKKQQEHQKFIDTQRALAKQKLEQDINRMNNKYKDFTPKAAFTSFVSSMPSATHNVYWDMFNYQQQKVVEARKAMKSVLDNGGSLQKAREAYNSEAAIKRVKLIDMTRDLNVKYGLADESVQSTFDKYGKLPRYD